MGLISVGWDPGLFSMQRLLFESVLVSGSGSIWAKECQGHSDAIRRVEVCWTENNTPSPTKVPWIRLGQEKALTLPQETRFRECFVVAAEGADKALESKRKSKKCQIILQIMIHRYIYNSRRAKENHSKIPHGGFVIHSGKPKQRGKQTTYGVFNKARQQPGVYSKCVGCICKSNV